MTTAFYHSGSVNRAVRMLLPLMQVQQILTYEDSVAAHLTKILTSDQHSVVISSAKYDRLSVVHPIGALSSNAVM